MHSRQPTGAFVDRESPSLAARSQYGDTINLSPRLASPSSGVVEAPFRASEVLSKFGRTLVVAPHPDDETLGCGGAIALLRKAGVPVHVLVISDGAAAQSRSAPFRTLRLVAQRETESLTALDRLGVLPPCVKFLRLPDGNLPSFGDDRFAEAVDRCAGVFQIAQPSTVLVPWRRDPHRDHRATWELAIAAAIKTRCDARWLEYPVWLWEHGQDGDVPRSSEAAVWRLDIAAVLPLKRRAVRAYRSQITDLIDDKPARFRLSTSVLARLDQPWEVFFEDRPDGFWSEPGERGE